MRNFTLGLLCGLVALAGFATSASASATVDLIWSTFDVGTPNIYSFPSSGDTSTLSVVLTAGPLGTIGGGVTVDYSAVASYLSVIGYSSTAFTPPLPFNIGSTVDTGTMVTNINAAGGLGPNQTLLNGASFVLGTITFQRTSGPVTGGEITVGFTGTDHLLAGDGTGSIIDGTVILNSAFAPVLVPEPGTISLLGMGLGGLYVVGRRSSRKS